jgi:hypothetical protein
MDDTSTDTSTDYYGGGRRLSSDNSSNTTNGTATNFSLDDVGSAAPLPRCRGCVIGDDDVADAETNTLGWAGELMRIK